MTELPLWPPIVALILGAIGYALASWETRKFDRKHPHLAPRKDD